MKPVLWVAAILFLATPVLLVGSCYVKTRRLVAECVRSCEEQGLAMSSFISDDPISPFPKGQCICLKEPDDEGATQ